MGEKTKKKKKEQKAKETDRDVGVVTMEKKDGEEEGKEKGRKKEGEGKEKKEKKKERRKEKEDPSRSGQPGTIADTEAIATAQPTMTGVPSTNSEEASFSILYDQPQSVENDPDCSFRRHDQRNRRKSPSRKTKNQS